MTIIMNLYHGRLRLRQHQPPDHPLRRNSSGSWRSLLWRSTTVVVVVAGCFVVGTSLLSQQQQPHDIRHPHRMIQMVHGWTATPTTTNINNIGRKSSTCVPQSIRSSTIPSRTSYIVVGNSRTSVHNDVSVVVQYMVVPRHDSSPETPEEPPSTTEYSTAVADDEHDHVGPAVVETDHMKTTNAVVAVASTTIVNDSVEQPQLQQRLPTVDATEHDSAVMNRLLRPFQMGDMLQTIIGRSILVFVAFGFLLQFFGYSYIVEFNDDDDLANRITSRPATTTSSTEMRPRKSPPQLRIGTMEERQFLEEIRRDMKQQISN
jgi:hypothetical protein